MGVNVVFAVISLSDGAGVTFAAVGLALPVTMLIALLAALSVAANASGAAGPLVRSAGRSGRAVPPVVTGCAVAVVALLTGTTNIALVAAGAMCAVCLPTATTALVETFSSPDALQRLNAAIAAGASPHYVALVVHLRASVRSVVAIVLRTAARMSIDASVLVVALAGAGKPRNGRQRVRRQRSTSRPSHSRQANSFWPPSSRDRTSCCCAPSRSSCSFSYCTPPPDC